MSSSKKQSKDPGGKSASQNEEAQLPSILSKGQLKKKAKIAAIAVGILAVVYVVVALVFLDHFMPNTKIGTLDISLKSSAEVKDMLAGALQNYSLEIEGEGFSFTASAADAGLDLDTQATVDAIHQDLNCWAWPVLVFGSHDETERLTTSNESSKMVKNLASAIDEFNKSATPPTNASISYDSSSKNFMVQSESVGTQLNGQMIIDAAGQALAYLRPKVALDSSYLKQPSVTASDSRIANALQQANTIASSNISLMFDTVSVGSIGGETLASMVTLNDQIEATLEQESLNAWVVDFAAKANTAGSMRAYTRADGKNVTVSGGVYGWEINASETCEAITSAAKEGLNGELALPCLSQGAVYTAAGQRDWGTKYLDVDISEQHVRFYGEDGNIIWEADCITGTPEEGRATVQGVWYVTDKESPYTLVGYSGNVAQYESHVTYWMPFEKNAIGFHDATWQPGFGGNLYREGYGSHGCVNLSYSDAETLYGLIEIRDVVVVHE